MYQYGCVSLIHNYIKIGHRGITNGSIQKSETTMMENFNNFRKTLYKTRVEEANLLRLTRKQKSLTNGINTVSSSPSSSFIFHIFDGNKNNDSLSKSSPIIRQRKNAAVIVPLTDDFNIVHKDKDDEIQSEDGSDDDNDSLNSASSLSNNIQPKPSYNRMTNYMVPSSSAPSPKAKGINRYHIASFDDSNDEGIDINTATTATTLTSSTAANRSSFSLKIVEEDDEDFDDDCDESDDHVNNDGTTLNLNTVHPSTTTKTYITHHDDNNDNDVTTNDDNNNNDNNSSRRESSHQTTVSRLSSTPSTRTKDGSFLSNITEIRLNIQVDNYYYCYTIICYTLLIMFYISLLVPITPSLSSSSSFFSQISSSSSNIILIIFYHHHHQSLSLSVPFLFSLL